jgi:hypothetical protein
MSQLTEKSLYSIPNPESYSGSVNSEVELVRKEIADHAVGYYGSNTAGIAVESIERVSERNKILSIGADIELARSEHVQKRMSAEKPKGLKEIIKSLLKGRIDPALLGLASIDEAKTREGAVRELVNAESAIGSRVLGKPLHGGRREFFLSPTHSNEWFWHEETVTGDKSITVRYIVSEDEAITKSVSGEAYEYVHGQELQNLCVATRSYHEAGTRELYPANDKHSDFAQAA